MRAIFVILVFVIAMAAASPIHGIWTHLPGAPVKRLYGFYNYLPREDDDRDKRNTIYYWTPGDDYVQY
ncbi:unnamed protein product [Caenorhabditis bovis]|uniref:Uncharacterized protein n=1 Tax=Caenorhabditis bovis TaxID=2654633 RepID=A0A8S1ET20_9PELO|nr:unnamed protein product [Caenorhabditis bovis]